MKKTCPICRSEFEPKSNNQRYCSPRCQRRANYLRNRDKIIKRVRAYNDKNREAYKERQKRYYRKNRKRILERNKQRRRKNKKKTCPVCGEEFETVYPGQVCCSPTCSSLRPKMKTKDCVKRKPKAPCNGLTYYQIPIEMCLNCELDDCKYE